MHRLAGVILVALLLSIPVSQTGCRRVHYTVQSAPSAPEHLGSFKLAGAEIPARVQIANFTIGTVDTQYPEREKETFRRHVAVALPTLLQETLGRRQVFAEVSRTESPLGRTADYLVTGEYSFFERLGTGGREWIPFAGTFGAPINEAWVKGTMTVRVTSASTGAVVLQKTYVEEHRDRTSVYSQPKVGYMQADHLAKVAQEIIDAVGADQPGGGSTTPAMSPTGSVQERLQALERLRRDGLVSDAEYRERRKAILDTL